VRLTRNTALPTLRYNVGRVAQNKSLNKTSDQFKVTKGFTRYWKRKYNDSSFHPKQHGGIKTYKFDHITRMLIEHLVWIEVCKDSPTYYNTMCTNLNRF